VALQISSNIKKSTRLYEITATLTARLPISDPVYFVLHDADTQNEIIAKAGLPDTTVFVAIIILDNGYIGSEYYYDLLITLDMLPTLATAHMHDSSTLQHPLREAYRDGPYIDLDVSLGPVEIYSDNDPDTVDYLRIHQGATNIFYIRRDNTISVGAHLEYERDTLFDIGSVDSGTTLRRPRDVYVGRDLYAARDAFFGRSAKSPYYRFFPRAVNPDSAAPTRHIYWNSVDNKPHAWDGITDYPLSSSGSGSYIFGTYPNSPTVGVGQVVVVAGANSVIPADAHDLTHYPAIGICVEKPDASIAVVQLAGEVIVFSGTLIPGQNYYLGPGSGNLTNDVSSYTTDMTVQRIGVSRTNSALSLTLNAPMVV